MSPLWRKFALLMVSVWTLFLCLGAPLGEATRVVGGVASGTVAGVLLVSVIGEIFAR